MSQTAQYCRVEEQFISESFLTVSLDEVYFQDDVGCALVAVADFHMATDRAFSSSLVNKLELYSRQEHQSRKGLEEPVAYASMELSESLAALQDLRLQKIKKSRIGRRLLLRQLWK